MGTLRKLSCLEVVTILQLPRQVLTGLKEERATGRQEVSN